MELASALLLFYTAIEEDVRIGPSHISIYMALLHQWNLQGEAKPFAIERKAIMKAAKINSRLTYNERMNNLQTYGYIKYRPATNASAKSVVYLKYMEK